MSTKPTMADVIAAHQMKRGVRDMRIHCTCGWVADIDRGRAGEQLPVHQADMLAAAGFGDVTAAKAGVIHRVRDACERVLLPHQETGEQTGIDFKPAVDQILYALDGADQ